MKEKNPLYVVKGKTVLEAKGVFDMLVKKLNLEPVLNMLINLLKMLMEQVSNYPMFVSIKKVIDEVMSKATLLWGR